MYITPYTNNNVSAYSAGGNQMQRQLGVSPVLPVEQLSSRNEERVIDGELLDREVHAANSTSNTGFTFDAKSRRESHPGFYQRQSTGTQQYAIDSYNDMVILGQSQNSTGVQNSVDYFV